MKLILIRHGATDYSLARRYCGFSDPPLNDKGIRQARQLAARVTGMRIDKIYSSDLVRARQTAEIVFPQKSVEATAGWREMNFGRFEGLTHEQLMHRHPTLYRNWVADPAAVKPPEGEGLRDLHQRVQARIAVLVSEDQGRTVAVVTHGGPIRIAVCDALQIGPAGFWQVPQALGAWNEIDCTAGAPPTVVVMNDVSHLTALEAEAR